MNIVDSDKLKAAYADRFQLMDRYTKEANQLRGDSMAFSGKLNLGVKVTSEGKVVPISLTGTVDGSMDPSAMNMQANLSMDLSQALAGAQLTAEDKALLENLKDLEINYILNLNTGMVYFNCPTLAKLDASSSADAWYAVSMNALYQDLLHLDIDFTSLLQGKDTLTVSEALLKSAEVAKDRQDAFGRTEGLGLSERTERLLREVATATLSAQLRKRGIHHAFIESVRPCGRSVRLLGRARTLRYLPLREDLFAAHGGG